MPESRHKYLYERLGDHDFQQLVGALLAGQFADFVPLPLRQADGGRDGLRQVKPGKLLIYQVKWSTDGTQKKPVDWLDAVVKGEEENLRRLAAEGVRHYTLVTNVPSTGKARTGTFDQLNARLDVHAKDYGFDQMACVWREGLNGWVDNASTELKWTYAEMLAGWDLIRYLMADHLGSVKSRSIRDLMRNVAATQWDEDQGVKFSQAEVDRERVMDLFVDVGAERVGGPPSAERSHSAFDLGGGAEYLLRASSGPFSLVRGAPGQGKSTMAQFVSQMHRATFVPSSWRPANLAEVSNARFPIRFDLSEYARWLAGADIWNPADDHPNATRRTGAQATVEAFLADLLTHESGGILGRSSEVHDLLERMPSLVVLDGLDEVGNPTVRSRVVSEIDKFASRCGAHPFRTQLIVTTRPSAGQLPEPSSDQFEVISLRPFNLQQRNEYLRKWCAVRGIRSHEGRNLRARFKEMSKEPYIEELASNPMQLTILLDLLSRHGAATPAQRTDLYDKYVELLLAREANKHPVSVKKHREELLEIIPFLGWYLQAHSESSPVNNRMSIAELKEAMRHFQRTYGNSEAIVDELFEGATDRLWALTSKVQGTFEFEVLSLREYFAARFLYHNVGEGDPDFDSGRVLRELLRRPYWLNTARFYGGNARGNGIYVLAAGVIDVLTSHASSEAYLASWTLLTDGVFLRRPREARRVLAAVCTDKGIPVLLMALQNREIRPLPALPDLPSSDGPDPTWARLTDAIRAAPGARANRDRVQTLRLLMNQRTEFTRWWMAELPARLGTEDQSAWLRLAAFCEGAAGQALDLDGLDLSNGTAQLLLNTGIVPPSDSNFERALLLAVTAGECPDVRSTRSLPAQVAVALSPESFFTSSEKQFAERDERARSRRNEANRRLRLSGSPFFEVSRRRAFKAGSRGSTFPWANTASALQEVAGRCWLACEIAVIGAASPHHLAYTRQPARKAFGTQGHPGELIAQTRNNAGNAAWWREQLAVLDDDLAPIEWAVSLRAVAEETVQAELKEDWLDLVSHLSSSGRVRLSEAISRLGKWGWLSPSTPLADASYLRHEDQSSNDSADDAQVRGSEAATQAPRPEPSLLSVSRNEKWLKVDALPVYR